MNVRKAELADAEKLLKMLNELDNETSFMMYEPGERESTVSYKKFGFKVEGVKEKSLRVNGAFVDEYYMARLVE